MVCLGDHRGARRQGLGVRTGSHLPGLPVNRYLRRRRRRPETCGVGLVEVCGEPLAGAPGVDEDQRRAVGQDLVEDRVLKVRPDRGRHPGGHPRTGPVSPPRRHGPAQRPVGAPGLRGPRPPEPGGPGAAAAARVRGCCQRPLHPGAAVRDRRDAGHVLHRHGHRDLRRRPAVVGDDRHRVRPAEEPGGLLRGRDGGGQADALRRAPQEVIEALQGHGQVCAALGTGEGVDLVDDDRLHRPQRLSHSAGEHEVERLRRRDEDAWRVAAQPTTLPRGRVPRAHAHRDRTGGADGGDSRQRPAQVAFDVSSQRLERRDVEDPHAVGLGRRSP